MALLAKHLEQIELCASTILDLPFPAPGIFTNAILPSSDITKLLRDPDPHESALFTVIPTQEFATQSLSNAAASGVEQDDRMISAAARFSAPRRHTAVAVSYTHLTLPTKRIV